MTVESNSSKGALSGLRILDLTGRMGGYCGLLLANLGAQVILVEPPGGDVIRHQGPFKDEHFDAEQSLSFAAYHTNKNGIVLDLEIDKHRETLRQLVTHADALIEDKPAGYLERLGLGYGEL
ncbi:MAG TPA: CoA transferase, partial [Candidatus Binatia bacterium]|nr:CoA transferase [Candidatus Binatia bacterium]